MLTLSAISPSLFRDRLRPDMGIISGQSRPIPHWTHKLSTIFTAKKNPCIPTNHGIQGFS